jgi:hypothetical protein
MQECRVLARLVDQKREGGWRGAAVVKAAWAREDVQVAGRDAQRLQLHVLPMPPSFFMLCAFMRWLWSSGGADRRRPPPHAHGAFQPRLTSMALNDES